MTDTPPPPAPPYWAVARARGERFVPYVAGLLCVAAAFLLFSLAAGLLLVPRPGSLAAPPGALDGQLFLLAVFLANGLVAVVLALLVRPLHGRSWRTLISPDGSLRPGLLVRSALLWGGILGGAVLAALAASGEAIEIDFATALRNVAVVGAAVVLQTAAEEMLFRGYLTQGLGLLFRGALGPALLVAAPFALGHAVTHAGAATFAVLAFLSLFLSAVTWRADRLEPAIGLHLAQNLMTLFLAGAEGLSGPDMLGAEGVTSTEWAALGFLLPAAGLYWLLAFRAGLLGTGR